MRPPWAQAAPTEVCARPKIALSGPWCRLMELSCSQVTKTHIGQRSLGLSLTECTRLLS